MKAVKTNRKSQGFALTELMIAIGIVAALLATIAAVAGGLMSSSKASDQSRIIESVGQDLNTKYKRANNFSGLTTTVAINLGAFPEQMVNGTTVLNAWNGTVTVEAAADINSVPERAVLITWPNVPSDECAALATGPIGANRVRVGSTEIQKDGMQIDVAGAGTACSTETNTVDFLFHKS